METFIEQLVMSTHSKSLKGWAQAYVALMEECRNSQNGISFSFKEFMNGASNFPHLMFRSQFFEFPLDEKSILEFFKTKKYNPLVNYQDLDYLSQALKLFNQVNYSFYEEDEDYILSVDKLCEELNFFMLPENFYIANYNGGPGYSSREEVYIVEVRFLADFLSVPDENRLAYSELNKKINGMELQVKALHQEQNKLRLQKKP